MTSPDRQEESGFTLIELMVAITISAFVIGAAASVLLVVMRNYSYSATRLVESHDAQLISLWLTADVLSAGPATNIATTPTLSGCGGLQTAGNNVLKLSWSDFDTAAAFEASYRLKPAPSGLGYQLIRYFCSSGDRTVVARDVTPSGATATVAVDQVNLAVNVLVNATPYSFNVSASRRTTTVAAPITTLPARDTTPPNAPSVPKLDPASDTGALATDNITKDTTPTFFGTAEANSSITLYEGAATVGSATTDAAGNWRGAVAPALSDGNHMIRATATDTAGNVSPASAGQIVTIDTVRPDAPTAVTLANGGGVGNAYINSTNAGSLNFTVTILAGARNASSDTVTVTLTGGATVSGVRTPSNPGGTVSVTAVNGTTLTDGSVAVIATVTDLAGNVSTAAAGTAIIKDTVVTGALSPVLNHYTYIDNTNPAADTLSGSIGAITSWGTDNSLDVVAVELTGPHPNTRYVGLPVASGGNGSFPTITVDNTMGSVDYQLFLMDSAGNQTAVQLTITATDTK